MTATAYRPEQPADAPRIDALIDRAFGPGRHAKAADRLREANTQIPDLSFTAWDGGALVGSVRLWPVAIGGEPVVFLGPIPGQAELPKHRCCPAPGWR